MKQHIVVVDYNPRWKDAYEREAELISEILGGSLVEIHHIGSTSVEGLAAKPIIDIMPVVRSLSETDSFQKAFETAGYEYLGEFGMSGRRYLRKGGAERTHQIHIFREDNRADIERHLAVRDFLRTHRETAEEYGKLKKALAAKHPYDIEGYCAGKDAFVKELETGALAWKRGFL